MAAILNHSVELTLMLGLQGPVSYIKGFVEIISCYTPDMLPQVTPEEL